MFPVATRNMTETWKRDLGPDLTQWDFSEPTQANIPDAYEG